MANGNQPAVVVVNPAPASESTEDLSNQEQDRAIQLGQVLEAHRSMSEKVDRLTMLIEQTESERSATRAEISAMRSELASLRAEQAELEEEIEEAEEAQGDVEPVVPPPPPAPPEAPPEAQKPGILELIFRL